MSYDIFLKDPNSGKTINNDTTDNYWDATEGNARKALLGLLKLAVYAPPDSVWDGD